MNLFFKNTRIVDPIEQIDKTLNIWLKDGVIAYLGDSVPNIDSDTDTIDASDLVCAPGLYDMHVHLREPGFEYKETIKSGAEAAANGGFTGVLCMPNTSPVIDDTTVLNYIKDKSKDLLTDVNISATITKGEEGEQLSPMFELDDAGALLFTDDGKSIEKSEVMRRAFDYAATRDLLISQHCEEHSLTDNYAMNEGILSYKLGLKGYPSVAEEIIASRDIVLSDYCGNRRYHLQHISTKGTVRLLREAKSRGLRISAEVTPHHISLTDELLTSYDPNLKMNPPLRTQEDVDELISGLKDGTIDCIASDHAPHALHEKEVEFELAPNGIVGLETSLAVSLTYLYHTKQLTLNQIIEIMSTNPRKILKLNDIKIKQGEKANLTFFNPDKEWIVDKNNFVSKSANSPFIGNKLKGKPYCSVNNDQIYFSK